MYVCVCDRGLDCFFHGGGGVRLPRRTAVDGCQSGLMEGGGGLVQRAVLVELWRKIVHAALGFPAFALVSPPPPHPFPPSLVYPLCSRRPSAVWKVLGQYFRWVKQLI